MNSHQIRILRSLSTGPKSIRLFTEGLDQLRVAPIHIFKWVNEMQDEGLIERDRDSIQITDEGRDFLLSQSLQDTSIASARVHCNANMPVWTPKEWKTVRTGADDHLNYRSWGIGA